MGKPDKKADGPRLEWTVSPWTANWKRPAGALAMCVILALLAGFSVNYPNYSVDTVPTTGQDAAVEERTPEEIAELTAYRDNWVGRSLIWSLFGVVLLVGMTASIYLPVRYRLDDRGVTTFFLWVPTTRPWNHYRNYYVHDTGIHLTTMAEPSPLDAFRGHYIQYGQNRDEVKAFVAARIERSENKD